MKKPGSFDFWYAVNNTEVILAPKRHLETFGSTVLNYHLVSELMDTVNQIRIREGRIQAHQPKIITPQAYAQTLLEGFGEEASQYIDWLREHEQDLRVLQYGYHLKQEAFSEHIVSDSREAVVDRVRKEVEESGDPLSAVVVGVDTPWDVCLVKLFWEVIQGSAMSNIRDLDKRHMFQDSDGVPSAMRREIDQMFVAASKDPSLIGSLNQKLHHYGLFEEYQDRFFSLIKSTGYRE